TRDDEEKDRSKLSAPAWDAKPALEEERQRAARRARLAIALLKLGGFSGAARLELDLQKAASDTPALRAFSAKLRLAFTSDVAKEIEAKRSANDYFAADRLGRVLDPLGPGLEKSPEPA